MRKIKQFKLVPIPFMELYLRRLVLSLACEAVEAGEEKCQELELREYNVSAYRDKKQ